MEGRDNTPSAMISDAQTVKIAERRGPRGFSPASQPRGRKRHMVVNAMGMIMAVVAYAANIQDPCGAK